MPLTGDPSKDIPELIDAGHPRDQAIAIAMKASGDQGSTARVPDINGWYMVPDNPISRVGVFPYSAKSIKAPGWESDPNKVWMVYRPEEELSDPATVKSFRLAPWINDHVMLGDPAVNPALVPAEEKGAHGVIGEQTYYNPEDRTLYGNLKIWSNSLSRAIDMGKKELSLGFRCVYDFVSGVFEGQPYDAIQRTIRGNHIASVDAGRMGPSVAVLDHLTITFDAKDLIAMPTPKKKVTRREIFARKLKITMADPTAMRAAFDAAMDEEVDDEGEGGGGSPTLEDVAKMLDSVAPTLAKIKDTLATLGGAGEPDGDEIPPGDEMEPEMDATGKPVMDAATGKPKMIPKKKPAPAAAAATPTADKEIAAMDSRLKSAETALAQMRSGLSAKSLLGEIAKRDALAAKAAPFVGTFDAREMTAAEVATYACGKLGLTPAKGAEISALESYLHNRPAPGKQATFALDAAPGAKPSTAMDEYLSGKAAA